MKREREEKRKEESKKKKKKKKRTFLHEFYFCVQSLRKCFQEGDTYSSTKVKNHQNEKDNRIIQNANTKYEKIQNGETTSFAASANTLITSLVN